MTYTWTYPVIPLLLVVFFFFCKLLCTEAQPSSYVSKSTLFCPTFVYFWPRPFYPKKGMPKPKSSSLCDKGNLLWNGLSCLMLRHYFFLYIWHGVHSCLVHLVSKLANVPNNVKYSSELFVFNLLIAGWD